MSNKASDKRYKITLTEKQLNLIGKAVEMMLRTSMGQMYDLAEWLTLSGYAFPSGSTEFDIYLAQRNLIESVLEGISRDITESQFPHGKGESNSVQELKTLYEAIRHQQWKDSGADEWDVRSHKPMMCGSDPVPNIERVDGWKRQRFIFAKSYEASQASQYPDWIDIEMQDGKTVRYKR